MKRDYTRKMIIKCRRMRNKLKKKYPNNKDLHKLITDDKFRYIRRNTYYCDIHIMRYIDGICLDMYIWHTLSDTNKN